MRYLYDEFQDGVRPERFLSDYEHHVYFPRELELLFHGTGFAIEAVWGDYQASSLTNRSRSLVMVGTKLDLRPDAPTSQEQHSSHG